MGGFLRFFLLLVLFYVFIKESNGMNPVYVCML